MWSPTRAKLVMTTGRFTAVIMQLTSAKNCRLNNHCLIKFVICPFKHPVMYVHDKQMHLLWDCTMCNYYIKHVAKIKIPTAMLFTLTLQGSSFFLTHSADWHKGRILVCDGLIKILLFSHFSIKQQCTSQSITQPANVAYWAKNSFCPFLSRNLTQ